MTWKPISEAPANTWLLVTWDARPDLGPAYGPWDAGFYDRAPPPPAMVALFIDNHWRAYSEDGGIYGAIPAPDRFMELPL